MNSIKNNDIKSPNLTIITGIVASALCLFAIQPAQAQATWTGGASPDLNWSTGGNWSGGTGGSGEPSSGDAVVFGDAGTVSDPATVNNIVDLSFAGMIASLTYQQNGSGAYQVTEIPAGQTLSVAGDTIVGGLNLDGAITEDYMTGGGTFAPAGTTFHVGNIGSSSTSSLHATLDMSGLSNFVYDVSGGTWVVGGSGGDARGGGVLNFAGVSNNVTVGTINFNTGSGNNSGFHSLIQFGAGTNILNVGTFHVCETKARFADVQFISSAPDTAGLRLRGVDGNVDDTSRATIILGDRNNTGSSDTIGQLLLNGHPVDVKADTLTVGQVRTSTSSSSTRSGQGVLEFDNGTVDANTVVMANLSGISASSTALGTITVGANGTLVVGTNGISLVTQNSGTAAGTLNISGNVLCSGDIFKATSDGTASITINSGVLSAGGILGGADAPIDSLDISDATLTLAAKTTANSHVTTLTCGGSTNVINLTGVPVVTGYPAQIPLIQYAGTLGGTFNIGVGTFPPSSPSYTGYITNNETDGSIDLVLTGGKAPAQLLTWSGATDGNWDTTTANWLSSGSPATYSDTDFVQLDDTATGTTAINLTTTLLPSSVTVSNVSKTYGLTGGGYLSGAMNLIKDGAGTLYITNSGLNDYTGGLNIRAGTVRVGDGAYSGNLGSGAIANNGTLVFNRADAITVADTISGGGSLTKLGTGSLELTTANSYDGATTVQAGTLKTSNNSALGTANGATTVSGGASLDVSGSNLGDEPVNVTGTGDGGNGAIINSGADQIHALQYVTLQGDTTVGGSGRWDIRSPSTGNPALAALSTGGNAYKFTKTGANQISLVGATVDPALGDVDVQQGVFGIEAATTGLGNPASKLTIASGATLELYQLTNQLDKVISLTSDGFGDTILNNSGANTIVGPITLMNDCYFNVGGTSLALNGNVSGGGSIIKVGNGNFIIGGNATEAGITANSGQVTVNGTHTGPITCNYFLVPTAFAGFGTNNGTTDLYGDLFPGDTNVVGTITLSGLTLEGGATVSFDLGPDNTVGGTNNDLIQVNGDLTVNGNAVKINPMGVLQLGVPYRFANYTGNLIMNGDLTVTGPNGQYIFTVDTSTPGQINLVVSGGPPVWDGGSASNNNWSDANNWSGVALNPGNSMIFAGTSRLNNTNDTADATSYSGIIFDSTAGAFVLNGNSVTLTGTIGNNSTNLQIINLPLSYGTDLSFDGGSGGVNITSGLTNTAGSGVQVLTLSGNGSTTDLITNQGSRTTFSTTSNANWTLLDNSSSEAIAAQAQLNIVSGGTWTFGSTNSAPVLALEGADGTSATRCYVGDATGTSTLNIVNGSLTIQSRLNIGNGTGGAILNMSGGSLTVNGAFQVADNNMTTVGAVNMSGGTLTPTAGTMYLTSRGTGTLNMNGGTVDANSLELARNLSGQTPHGTVNLNGGTLMVNRIQSSSTVAGSTAVVNFNGGTLGAKQDNTTFLTVNTTIPIAATVQAGGAVIDSSTFSITIPVALTHDSALGTTPDGGLTKLGDGTLTLSGANSYTGDTTVNAGTLAIAQATLATNSTVLVTNGAMLELDFSGANTVAGLVLDGVSQPGGVYDASTSPSFISGTGSLLVASSTPPALTITDFGVSGTTLTMTAMNGSANGQFILLGSTNVALPLSSWTPVLTNNFDGSGNLNLSTNIVDPNNPQEFYILMQ